MFKKILIAAFVTVSISGYAQKIKVLEGDLKALKGQKSINTEFTYTDMGVGKDLTEEAYLKKRKGELNEKEAGRGDKFEKQWFADRKERFEPQFRELFSKYTDMTTVDPKATYTLIFKTTRTEPGWNVGVMRSPAAIDAEAWLVETADHSKVLCKISLLKVPGRDATGYDFETGARLQESYAKAGKELGKRVKDIQ
jgi:hypothetical protein